VDAVFSGKPGNLVGEKGKKISWAERLALYHGRYVNSNQDYSLKSVIFFSTRQLKQAKPSILINLKYETH